MSMNNDADANVPENSLSPRLKRSTRAQLEERFGWPRECFSLARPLWELHAVMDTAKLEELAASVHRQREIAFAIISQEYIQIGLNWVFAMRKIGLTNFLIIAGDQSTSTRLNAIGVKHVLATVDERALSPSFVSVTGFRAKGLAVSAFKFPVVQFLLKAGYTVVLSDADAVWLKDPMPHLRHADLSFQRVVYHPPQIARLWGFSACSGFLAFRHGPRSLEFVERCIEEHRMVLSDQVAVNLALLEADPNWTCDSPNWTLPDADVEYARPALEELFARHANIPIRGKLRSGGLNVLGLPHNQFWRHEIVASPREETVICHPNSPKDDSEKMKIFRMMNLCFAPPNC